MRRHREDWNEAEEQKLKDEFINGITISAIAAIHERTEIAIRNKLYHLGFSLNYRNKFWTDERIKFLTDSYINGMLIKEIAYQLKITKNAAMGKIWRLGLCKPPTQLVETHTKTESRLRKFSWEDEQETET